MDDKTRETFVRVLREVGDTLAPMTNEEVISYLQQYPDTGTITTCLGSFNREQQIQEILAESQFGKHLADSIRGHCAFIKALNEAGVELPAQSTEDFKIPAFEF